MIRNNILLIFFHLNGSCAGQLLSIMASFFLVAARRSKQERSSSDGPLLWRVVTLASEGVDPAYNEVSFRPGV